MIQQKVSIIENKLIKPGYFKLVFKSREISKAAKPGQFIQVKIGEDTVPLLRRPISIHDVQNENVKILYQVVGEATKILSKKKEGEIIDIIGPLGNGFSWASSSQPVLIAGGIGVAPLLFLARNMNKKPAILLGARTKDHILCHEEFKKLKCHVNIATDDGSACFNGTAVDLLKNLFTRGNGQGAKGKAFSAKNLKPADFRKIEIFACGPKAMLKEIAKFAKSENIKAQISLEEHMACGIGACLGCVVKVKSSELKTQSENKNTQNDFEYKRVCKEGPVFEADEILF